MIVPPMERDRPARFSFCSQPDCHQVATLECGSCRKRYCIRHMYDNVPDGVQSKGLVCVQCRDRRLSHYTGVRLEQFKTLGEPWSGE